MYQESLIRLDMVGDAPSMAPEEHVAYSSANDPFLTYMTLAETFERLQRQEVIPNLYLSPLATKPQAVGFAMFYLDFLTDRGASIVFPFARQYAKETSTGVGRTWIYTIGT